MEKVKTKWMLKLITILCVIASMLFSSISPIIVWATEENTVESEQDQYVTFDVNWQAGGKEISGSEGQWGLKFDLQFDTIESFKNVKVEIGKADNANITLNNVGEYFSYSSNSTSGGKIQYFKDIPGGAKIAGTGNIEFFKTNDYSSYTDEIPVTITGYYEVDGETKEINITKTLTANVKPSANKYYHTASLDSKGQISASYSSNTNVLMSVNSVTVYLDTWTNVSRSEKCEFNLNLYRTDKDGNKYYPSSVIFQDSSFKMTKSGEEDGLYTFVRGEEHDECDESSLFNISQDKTWNYEARRFTIKYNIDDPEAQGSTYLYNYINLKSTGYVKTIDGNGTSYEKTVLTADRSYSGSQVLYRYTPDVYNWGNTGIKGTRDFISQQALIDAIENKKMEIQFNTTFKHVTTGNDVEGDCTISRYGPYVRIYNPSTRTYYNRALQEGEIYLKSIEVPNMPNDEGIIEFYKQGETNPFFTATNENLSYTVPDGEIIGNFSIVVKNIQYNRINSIETSYEMNTEKMKQNGMTDDIIKNIRNIYMRQKTSPTSGAPYYTETDGIAAYDVSSFGKIKVSHLWLPDDTQIEATAQEIGKNVAGKLYFNIGYDSSIAKNLKEMELSATNPILYIRLPDQFDFDIKNVTTNSSNLVVDSYKIKKLNSLNGTKVLQVNCKGNVSDTTVAVKVTVDYDRVLKSGVTYSNVQTIVHMETDEGQYYRQEADVYDENENGNYSENMAYAYRTNSIQYSQTIQLKNQIQNKLGEYVSGQDVILEQGDKVHYRVVLENNYVSIKNTSMVIRLPFIDNKSILGNTMELGSEFTPINLSNVKVYYGSMSGTKTEVPSSKCTIKYSTDAEAGFDSEFANDIENNDTIKTMQIVFNGYNLLPGYMFLVEFDMDLPEGIEKGKVTYETSAVRYYTYSDNVKYEQEAAKQKVIIGDPKGEIEVVKEFKGTKTKESKENIKFRITNMANSEEYFEELTDSNGHATFTKVPAGEWEITEITEFNDYICQPKYVKITNGERYTGDSAITMLNKIKYSKLTVKKEWQDTNEIPGSVNVAISGKTVGEDDFSREVYLSVKTNSDGSEYQEGYVYVPYGTYTLHEESEYNGWYSDDVEVIVNEPESEGIIINKPTKGNIQIIKTVPEGETVLGLTFKITGRGTLSYKNKQGELVEFITEKTITVSEGNSDITISEDKRTATINVRDLVTGYYLIEEINMPTIQTDDYDTVKYASVKESVYLPNKNGETVPVNIENKYKTGDLKVTVTATEGTDLSLFKIKVSGISIFGHEYSEEFNVPYTGEVTIKNLEIGRYKVEEVGTKEVNGKIMTTNPDGYEVTYNPTDVSSNGVKVEYEKTANATIHNEYNGKGYVKILKSLEDEKDSSKAEGIKFRISGKDLTENQVFEELTIGKDGTATSGEIPVGTYLLEELEETVPMEYTVCEEQEITISTSNTKDNPLVLNIENKLATGKIIMETELAKRWISRITSYVYSN